MKYFTKELWAGSNADDETFDKTTRQWELNRKAYFHQLERLKPRLTKNALRFFTQVSLHDGRLLAFTTGDQIQFQSRDLASLNRNKGRAEVQMQVLNFQQNWLYRLNYSKIRSILFDHPTKVPLFHETGGPINDWGFDELTAAGPSYLRHEILFSSGATIVIEFQKFSFKRTRVTDSKGPVF